MTSIALVTTTISPPTVLRDYRACDDSVLFIVAGDYGCDDAAIQAVCAEVGNAVYLSYEAQEKLGYACHEPIGRRVIQRRNIAILEAIRSGADIIVTVDTDNVPNTDTWFDHIRRSLSGTTIQNIVEPKSHSGWFNPGELSFEHYYYRGFPFWLRSSRAEHRYVQADIEQQSVQVGVLNALVFDDPDTDAIERITRGPRAQLYGMDDGATINPQRNWAPINSQSTAWRRELAPLMLLPPGIGRYDDIWGSYIAQRVLQETDYHVMFGPPFVRQDRHDHDLLKDLEQELWGMRHTERFVSNLKTMYPLDSDTILGKLRILVAHMARWEYLPQQTRDFLVAWVEDVERVL